MEDEKTCRTCIFRVHEQCHRYPPTVIYIAKPMEILSKMIGIFPPITLDEPGCGEHKTTETDG